MAKIGDVAGLAAITLASAPHAALNLGRPGLIGQVQCARLGQLSPGRVGWALVESVVSVANVGEVVDLVRLGQHVYGKSMDWCISPLLS